MFKSKKQEEIYKEILQLDINSMGHLNESYIDSISSEEQRKLALKTQEARKGLKTREIDNEYQLMIKEKNDISEYNRWALRISQKWLLDFYKSNCLKRRLLAQNDRGV